PSSGGVGGLSTAASTVVLQNELNRLIDDYQGNMKEVEYSAYAIRDRVLEWLGFTKNINTETEEVYFTLDKLSAGGVMVGLLASTATLA
ncbi:hypothetical protein, partial [Klebsiella pneumoniae]|uniref:hypothetical protein n=1 Tax=Klebsiella pneumoniae TaxID=573 RepID=UPI002730FD79